MTEALAPSLDGRTFVGVSNSASGEVSGETVFHYCEQDGTVCAWSSCPRVLNSYRAD